MDHLEDTRIITGLIGKICERTLACSSIKLRFGGKRSYIWIDPPWILAIGSEIVTVSEDYPNKDSEHKKWSSALNLLNRVVFTSFQFKRGTLTLEFSNGCRLCVPPSLGEIDTEDFYHHWYASE